MTTPLRPTENIPPILKDQVIESLAVECECGTRITGQSHAHLGTNWRHHWLHEAPHVKVNERRYTMELTMRSNRENDLTSDLGNILILSLAQDWFDCDNAAEWIESHRTIEVSALTEVG